MKMGVKTMLGGDFHGLALRGWQVHPAGKEPGCPGGIVGVRESRAGGGDRGVDIDGCGEQNGDAASERLRGGDPKVFLVGREGGTRPISPRPGACR